MSQPTESNVFIYDGYGEVKDKNVVHVIVKDGVRKIPRSAFQMCWDLSNIELPSYVTKIGKSAFKGCVSF